MIEIDDAGGGCFIGPEILVIHRLETGAVWYLHIPPAIEARVEYATQILKAAFRDLEISTEETIRLCRGEIFDPFQLYLSSLDYQVLREKVSAATDKLAENRFMAMLYSYGLPRSIKLKDRDYRSFYEMVGCWYYSQSAHHTAGIRKIRLKPPFWIKKVARSYPNLIQIMLESDQVAG